MSLNARAWGRSPGEAGRGRVAGAAAEYQPKGLEIRHRGVGGIVDIGWGAEAPQTKEIDNVVTGCATVVKKLTVQHR